MTTIIPKNPYIVGSYIAPGHSTFVARNELLNNLREMMSHHPTGYAIVLHGLRRIGKTTLLRHLLESLHPKECATFINMESFALADVKTPHLLHVFAKAMRCALAQKDIDIALPSLPEWLQHYTQCWHEFLDSLQRHMGEYRILLLIDEFELLFNKIDKEHIEHNFLNILSALIREENNIFLIVAGSNHLLKLRGMYESSFFQSLVYLPVSCLSESESRWLIEIPMKPHLSYEHQAVDTLVFETGGHPYILQQACYELVKEASIQEQTVISKHNVEMILAELIERNGTNSSYISMVERADIPLQAQLIFSLISRDLTSHPPYQDDTLQQALTDFGLSISPLQCRKLVRHLKEQGLLLEEKKNGGSTYRIAIPLLARWTNKHRDIDDLIKQATPPPESSISMSRPTQPIPDSVDSEQADTSAVSQALFTPTPSGSIPELQAHTASKVATSLEQESVSTFVPDSNELFSLEIEGSLKSFGELDPASSIHLKNPYTTGAPVYEDHTFFGRHNELREACSIFGNNIHHIQIHGPRRMGKTSLLQRIWALGHKLTENAIFVYWDTSSYHPESSIGFIEALYRKIVAGLPQPLRTIASYEPNNEGLKLLLQHITQRGYRVFLFLDEFQALVRRAGLQVPEFSYLRSLSQDILCKLSYVIASTIPLADLTQDAVASEFDNVFFKRFAVGPLDRESALAMVIQPALRVGWRLPEGIAEEIYRLCAGHPWLTALCACQMVNFFARHNKFPSVKDLQSNDMQWQKTTLEELYSQLEAIYRPIERASESLQQEVKTIVTDHFRRYYHTNALPPAARLLLSTGLCHMDQTRLVPTGTLAKLFLRSQFGLDRLINPEATPEEITAYINLLSFVEPQVRAFLANNLSQSYGTHWKSNPKLPQIIRDTLHKQSKNGDLGGLSFGLLLCVLYQRHDVLSALASRVTLEEKELRKQLNHAVKIRNDIAHNRTVEEAKKDPDHIGPIPPPKRLSSRDLKAAHNVMQGLEDFLAHRL